MTFILKQDGAEVKRGDEQAILHYMHKSMGVSAQVCAITSISLKRIFADAGRRTAIHNNDDLSAPISIELSVDGWLSANKDVVREITTAKQKGNGDARMFVVKPVVGADGRVVWFNRTREDGTRTLRQFSIRHLNSNDTVRWPTGSISRTRPVNSDAGMIRYLNLQVKKWGIPKPVAPKPAPKPVMAKPLNIAAATKDYGAMTIADILSVAVAYANQKGISVSATLRLATETVNNG